MAFVSEIKTFFHKTILLSGSISKGSDIAAALAMGADLAYAGTVFITTEEANASDEYQKMIMDSEAKDVIYTAAISGVNANFMLKSLEKNGITEEQWTKTKKIDFGSELDSAQAEAKAWKTVWSAGHGVGAINEVLPVKELIENMKEEFKAATAHLNHTVKEYKM